MIPILGAMSAARLSRPVLIGLAALVILIGVSGWTYTLGLRHSSQDCAKLIEVREQAARKLERESWEAQLDAMNAQARREREIESMADIPRPDAACGGPEWLHSIEDAVRSANHITGAD